MKRHFSLSLLFAICVLNNLVIGQEFPTHVDIASLAQWNSIRETGSDARSQEFNDQIFQDVKKLVGEVLVSNKVLGDRSKYRLDQDKLFTTSLQPYPIRVYFIGEGAGYKNSVGLKLNVAGAETGGDMRLLFPDCSMPVRSYNWAETRFDPRRPDAPLMPGDFVEIGSLHAGVQLDFFIVENGARGGRRRLYSNRDEQNIDKMQHVVSFMIPDSPYILVSFEDMLNGGDSDYEDVLIVVDIGMQNAMALLDASNLPN